LCGWTYFLCIYVMYNCIIASPVIIQPLAAILINNVYVQGLVMGELSPAWVRVMTAYRREGL